MTLCMPPYRNLNLKLWYFVIWLQVRVWWSVFKWNFLLNKYNFSLSKDHLRATHVFCTCFLLKASSKLNWLLFSCTSLHQDRSNASIRCIYLNQKSFVEVWTLQYWTANCPFQTPHQLISINSKTWNGWQRQRRQNVLCWVCSIMWLGNTKHDFRPDFHLPTVFWRLQTKAWNLRQICACLCGWRSHTVIYQRHDLRGALQPQLNTTK